LRLAAALGWHAIPFEPLLELVRLAERLGFAAVFVDGDVSQLPSRPDAEVLDGLVTTASLLARTERIEVASIRLVHHWNAAKLAQATATLARLHPGRVRLFVSIGGQPADRRFGLPVPPAGERIAWLDETLGAVRALWSGGEVTRRGRFVALEGARVLAPREPIPIHVAAGPSKALLGVVARHADGWDVNLPPLRERVAGAEAILAHACAAAGRDPQSLSRSMWIFARPGREPGDPELAREFRRWNPWFRELPDAVLGEVIVCGPPGEARDRIERIGRALGLALPVADLSGLPAEAAAAALYALAPKKPAR
jgi:alkanesulfonate monooxygenase SsuD/methylene tetrahydromethanopterin reductase-like flavin-dependent oxidoreductase (luciferase family)